METLDFQKFIGKPVYVIWYFTSRAFKTKGNGVYTALSARDEYVQLQKGGAQPFWALCDDIEDVRISNDDIIDAIKSDNDSFNKSKPKIKEHVAEILNKSEAPKIEVMAAIKESKSPAKPKRKRPSRAKAKSKPASPKKETFCIRKPGKSRAYKTKPRIGHKDGVFFCHFGVKYIPGINVIGRGETREDAYHAWKAANDKLIATKAARRAQKAANGVMNGSA